MDKKDTGCHFSPKWPLKMFQENTYPDAVCPDSQKYVKI